MGSVINNIEIYLPTKTLSNEELAVMFPEWTAEKIGEKIGIKKRHISANNETALDMAVKASEKLMTPELKERIDFVLLCTQSPDYFLPTSACMLQDRLGLRTNIGALDYNLGCSGFIYGLSLVKGLINSETASCVLLVVSETYSKHIHETDKSNRSIFGDGAAAIIIEKSSIEHIGNFVLGTDGKGSKNLIAPVGGFRKKISNNGFNDKKDCLYMDGPEIFNFTIKQIPSLVKETLVKNNLSIDTIDYVVFHQANKYILDYLRKKTKIPEEKFYINMENTGNTVSATIPIALKDAVNKGIIRESNKILIVGFGVGYSWGAAVIEL